MQAAKRLKVPAVRPDATAALPERRDDPSGDFGATVPALAAHGANLAQGIPGAEAAEAGVRSVVRGQSYPEALSDIRGAVAKIPAPMRIAERVAGVAPLAGLLPGGVSTQGAILGGAGAALSADPEPFASRVGNTIKDTALGYGFGKLMGGAGNLAQRSGLTDLVSKGLRGAGGMLPRAADAIDGAVASSAAKAGAPTAAADIEAIPSQVRLAQRQAADGISSGPAATVAAKGASTMLRSVGKTAADVSEAIGTRGAANALLAQRKELLSKLGAPDRAAGGQMLDHVDWYRTQGKKLYDVAKEDTQGINDPDLQRQLQDPDMKKGLELVRDALGTKPNPQVIQKGEAAVPRQVVAAAQGPQPALPSGKPASTREAIKAFDDRAVEAFRRGRGTSDQNLAREGLLRQTTERALPRWPAGADEANPLPPAPPLTPSTKPVRTRVIPGAGSATTPAPARSVARIAAPGVSGGVPNTEASIVNATLAEPKAAVPEIKADLPSPEELHVLKRLIASVVQRKFNAPTGIDPVDAARLAPKLDALRATLHGKSEAWSQADLFWQRAKEYETAFTKAYGVQVTPNAADLAPGKLKTPEAISDWVQKGATNPGTATRIGGVQAGAKARVAGAIERAPLGADMGETLASAGAPLKATAPAAAGRRLAFPSGKEADAFEGQLQDVLHGSDVARSKVGGSVPFLKRFNPLSATNPLTSPQGQALRRELGADPEKALAGMTKAARGKAILGILKKYGVTALQGAR